MYVSVYHLLIKYKPMIECTTVRDQNNAIPGYNNAWHQEPSANRSGEKENTSQNKKTVHNY
jgi:hypothetical protein